MFAHRILDHMHQQDGQHYIYNGVYGVIIDFLLGLISVFIKMSL